MFLQFLLLSIFFIPNNNAQIYCDNFDFKIRLGNISAPCEKQLRKVCDKPELQWQFFDASSKLYISGMTYSSNIDYGNFPECLAINHEDEDGLILGKYCGLSPIILRLIPDDLTQQNFLKNFEIDPWSTKPQQISLNNFQRLEGQLKDNVVPSFNSTDIPFVISKYSSCVPDACTAREVGYFYLQQFLPFLYVDIPCETVNSNTTFDAGDIVVIIFLVIIGVLMIASTIYDALCQNFNQKARHPLLLSFSILYNGKKLLHISDSTPDQIEIFNGLRFISMLWVVAYHAASVFEGGLVSLENFPEVQEWNNNIFNRYITSGVLAVDTFFYIAGFLLAFSYIKSSQNRTALEQIKEVPKMYLHRYLRLTPAVAVMYLVTITIFKFFGVGPMWTIITTVLRDTCKDKWWKFFLYIQNYTDPDNMCVNPMWYLSADMQMFILAPIVLIPVALYIRSHYKRVLIGLLITTIASIGIPMLVRRYGDQSPGNIYTAHERFCNFLIGITFGATMRLYKGKPFIFGRLTNLILWIIVLIVSLAFNLYWFDVLLNFDLDKYTLFMGFYRPIWCLGLVFMTYSCYHNHGGIVQWILSRPAFQILGRLSYSMYVMHVLVEIYAGGTVNTTQYFSNYFLFYNFCGHIIVTMIVALIWVLAFEFPMLTIDKYILGGVKKTKKSAQ